MPAFQCGGETIPIDYDELVRALVATFGSTEGILDGLANASPGRGTVAALRRGCGRRRSGGWCRRMADRQGGRDRRGARGLRAAARRSQLAARPHHGLGTGTGVDADGHAGQRRRDGHGWPGAFGVGARVHARATAVFFEHDREDGPTVDGKKTLGSWYRLYDNPVTEKYNHGMRSPERRGAVGRRRLPDGGRRAAAAIERVQRVAVDRGVTPQSNPAGS